LNNFLSRSILFLIVRWEQNEKEKNIVWVRFRFKDSGVWWNIIIKTRRWLFSMTVTRFTSTYGRKIYLYERNTNMSFFPSLCQKKLTYLSLSLWSKIESLSLSLKKKKTLTLSIYEKMFLVDSVLSDHRIYQARAQL
jgi:hypothetical protein